MKASRVRVLDRFSAERAQRLRVGDLWTRYVAKQVAIRGRSSIRAIISSSAQEVGPTWPLHCGYHLRTGDVEALNDACHSVWGIAVKTSAASARAAIGRLSLDNPAIESDRSKGNTRGKH